MSNQVTVTSIDALESFRAALIVFLTKARRSVDNVGDDVRRTRVWLQHECRLRWETEVRKQQKALDQAKAELMNAKLSSLIDSVGMHQAAVFKAKRELAHAEEKLRNVKRWNQHFESLADPLLKKVDGLRQFLDHDLPKGVTFLVHAQGTLEAYAETHAPEQQPVPAGEPDPPQ